MIHRRSLDQMVGETQQRLARTAKRMSDGTLGGRSNTASPPTDRARARVTPRVTPKTDYAPPVHSHDYAPPHGHPYAPESHTHPYIPGTIFDAKGDLLVGTANDAYARLGAGANRRVLIADSAQATGMRWDWLGVGVAGSNRIELHDHDGDGFLHFYSPLAETFHGNLYQVNSGNRARVHLHTSELNGRAMGQLSLISESEDGATKASAELRADAGEVYLVGANTRVTSGHFHVAGDTNLANHLYGGPGVQLRVEDLRSRTGGAGYVRCQDTTWKLSFQWDNANSLIYFYINDTYVKGL